MIKQNYRFFALFLFGVLIISSAFQLSKLKFAFNYKDFQPKGDTEVDFYESFSAKFVQSSTEIKLGIYDETTVLKPELLKELSRFSNACKSLPNVKSVRSIANIREFSSDPFFPLGEPLLHLSDPVLFTDESKALLEDGRFVGRYISESGKMLLAYIEADSILDYEQSKALYYSILKLSDDYGFPSVHFAGAPIVNTVIIETQQKEFKKYVLLTSLIMVVFMILIFRTFWGVVIASFTVMTGLLIFFGLLGGGEVPLNLMSTLYPILMLIVGTSDVIHLMTKYAMLRQKGEASGKALRITIREVGLATLMTSITTAVGFFSLMTSSLPAIRQFGLFAGIGVLVAYVTAILFGMSLLSFFQGSKLIKEGKWLRRLQENILSVASLSRNRNRLVIVISALLIGVAAFGMRKVSTDVKTGRDYPRNHPIRQDYELMMNEMAASRNIELAIEAMPPYTIYSPEVVHQLEKMETFIEADSVAGKVYSPVALFKLANVIVKGGGKEHYVLPEGKAAFESARENIHHRLRGIKEAIISSDKKWAKCYVNIGNLSSKTISGLQERITAWAAQNINESQLKVKHTGFRYLTIRRSSMLVGSLLRSLGLAFVIVSILMGALFKDIRLILISLIPNLIPLVLTAGIIGWLNIGLDPKVAIIFTIAFGIAVDDTIHFLTKFRQEMQKGKGLESAISSTMAETGLAITLTSVILLAGFLVLTGSVFPPTFLLGLLISITLLTALIADLFLLPILLRFFLAKKQKVAKGEEN